jgi:hypothetical protein
VDLASGRGELQEPLAAFLHQFHGRLFSRSIPADRLAFLEREGHAAPGCASALFRDPGEGRGPLEQLGGVKGTLPSSNEERAVTVDNELSQADLEQVVGGKDLLWLGAVGSTAGGLAIWSKHDQLKSGGTNRKTPGSGNARLVTVDTPKKKR